MRPFFVLLITTAVAWQIHRFDEVAPPQSTSMECNHSLLELSTTATPIPRINLRADRDPHGGWNLQLIAQNFRFTPEAVNQVALPGSGHAHLHVDGSKRARLYGPWFHLPDLGKGTHQIRVTLNSNDHRVLAMYGEPIAATLELQE